MVEEKLSDEEQARRRGKELTLTEITATDAGGAAVAHGIQTYRIG